MDDLIEAYKATDYLVPEFDLCIKIDQLSRDLNDLCESRKISSWVFITAFNPQSKLLDLEDNQERNTALENDIKDYDFYHALGKPHDQKWPVEESFFIININLEQALLLAKKYQQNAIVFGLQNSEAKLILNKDFKI
ncbi:DUF3293 domain-containing protein [Lentisphaera profundi]|uniref:DUF3293 domain-containing protein n=1 Tax=Lentisphaera profundi TaxID=1658616 RepID=A0ABY7VS55_9BACT|nr:DUF3293 domain-containing protein [Lentisphaera profundi]WDE97038.1 DUF3293 domain-containing protein [Lentisphaera profundi]